MTHLIYEIGSNGFWTGVASAIEDTDPTPTSWTGKMPPSVDDGQLAAWGLDDWVTTTAQPQTGSPMVALDQDQKRMLYAQYADPLFFKWQASEATKDEWLQMRSDIKAGLITE